MTKYLDSPLKITGILLTLAGIFLSLFTTHPSLPEGFSLATMGIIMLITAWMITRSRLSIKDRGFIEICLVLLVILFSVLMALDYYGIIAFQQFLSFAGFHTMITNI
jgi:hypothetical protein